MSKRTQIAKKQRAAQRRKWLKEAMGAAGDDPQAQFVAEIVGPTGILSAETYERMRNEGLSHDEAEAQVTKLAAAKLAEILGGNAAEIEAEMNRHPLEPRYPAAEEVPARLDGGGAELVESAPGTLIEVSEGGGRVDWARPFKEFVLATADLLDRPLFVIEQVVLQADARISGPGTGRAAVAAALQAIKPDKFPLPQRLVLEAARSLVATKPIPADEDTDAVLRLLLVAAAHTDFASMEVRAG